MLGLRYGIDCTGLLLSRLLAYFLTGIYSSDAKGPLAAFMMAMAHLAGGGIRPPCSVVLAAVVDEEHQYRGVTHLLETDRKIVAAIVGEPTELDIVIAHKGCVRFQVRTHGKSAHSSMPWDGDNAIERMTQVIDYVRRHIAPALLSTSHPLVGPATICTTLIEGGSGINVVPHECAIHIDRRTLAGEEPLTIWRDYKDRLEALQPGHIEVSEPYVVDYALDTSADSQVVSALTASARGNDGAGDVVGVNYGTDASKIARAGIPAVVFGPGSIRDAHQPDESIDVRQVMAAAQIIADVLMHFIG